MEEKIDLILKKIDKIDSRLDSLEKRMKNVESKVGDMWEYTKMDAAKEFPPLKLQH